MTRLSIELKNWLVEQAEVIATTASQRRGEASQIRNLLQITQTESSVAVLRNFIRYQAARQATHKFWKPIHKPVISVLEEIESSRSGGDAELQRAAVQHFFGYLIRAYVYLTSDAPKEAEPEAHDASA